MIKIEFEKSDGLYKFRDAIVLPENHQYTEQQLEDMKEERFQSWLSMITESSEDEDALDEIIEE
jgi:hypothetical protein